MSNQSPAVASTTAHPSTSRTCDFAQVDVFAERPLEGNALAIFTDARGLTSDEMQALARETNLSETTFILPRAPEIERERGVRSASSSPPKRSPSPATQPSARPAGSIGIIQRFRGAEQITLDLGIGQSRFVFRLRSLKRLESSVRCDRTIQPLAKLLAHPTIAQPWLQRTQSLHRRPGPASARAGHLYRHGILRRPLTIARGRQPSAHRWLAKLSTIS